MKYISFQKNPQFLISKLGCQSFLLSYQLYKKDTCSYIHFLYFSQV